MSTSETTTERLEMRRTISPFDLTAADNLGAVISRPLLRGNNYDEWAIAFKTALCSRKKFGFLDGSITKPAPESPDFEDWEPINALIVSWLKMTIEPSLLQHISHRENAKDLWDHIRKRYAVTSGARNQQIKGELANCKQIGLTIEEYFGKLTKIWDSMISYRPLRVCTCGHCTCDLISLQEKDREEDQVHQFLFGLDDRIFGAIRSNLTSRVPFPTLEEAYNLVKQEEDMQNGVRTRETLPEASAFAAQLKQNRDLTIICKHCNRSGHTADKCFGVFGYPDWWGNCPKSRNITAKDKNKSGHTSSSKGRVCANVASTPLLPTVQANRALAETDRDSLLGITYAQWRAIRHALSVTPTTNTETISGMSLNSSWILDTGAFHHMTRKLDSLQNVQSMSPVLVILADGTERISVKEGTIRLGSDLILQSVFYVEEMKSDLISLGQLMDESNCVLQVAHNFLVIQDRVTRTVIGVGKRQNGTFYFCGMDTAAAVQTTEIGDFSLWHKRLGHPSLQTLKSLHIYVPANLKHNCDACFKAKQTRDPFPLNTNKSLLPFEMLHCDVWEPYRTQSSSGARYFLTVVDDYSRSVWVFLMSTKQETQTHLQNFLSLVETQFSAQVKIVQTDNGSEFMVMTPFLRSRGILHQTSCVDTPNQNGRVERKHRHILNVARALRFQAALPIRFWGECILTAAYLINRTPSTILQGKTPYKLLHHKPPVLSHLKVFGSLCYAHNHRTNGDKFAPRSRKAIFIGYPYGQKGWRLYDLENDQFFVSRDVVFIETEFPFCATDNGEEEAVQNRASIN